MLFFIWLLATVFLIYLSLRPSTLILKITLTILTTLSQIFVLLTGFIGKMFSEELYFSAAAFVILELLICTLYRCRYISIKGILAGLISLVILGIFQYYFGSVKGEISHYICLNDGMFVLAPYEIYRWGTYTLDVTCPWYILFNIVISPFWNRDTSSGNHWFGLFSRPNTPAK